MCLEVVNRKPFVEGTGYGWRVFKRTGPGKLYPLFQGLLKSIPEGQWVKEEDYRSNRQSEGIFRDCIAGFYPYGFHIWEKEKAADRQTNGISRKVKRLVKFRNVRVTGSQNRRRIIVAGEMWVLSKKTEYRLRANGLI